MTTFWIKTGDQKGANRDRQEYGRENNNSNETIISPDSHIHFIAERKHLLFFNRQRKETMGKVAYIKRGDKPVYGSIHIPACIVIIKSDQPTAEVKEHDNSHNSAC